ncbi:MAG: response regulator [Bacteroidetes bacterium]|jgi:signal transduction histidine kinase|nr:response regulator [Bacteroidota bacterium]
MMHILLVDDDSHNRFTLSEVLKAEGFSVDTASDGYEALEIVENRKFDAIISDALMPRMDGFALCRTMKSDSEKKSVPFIILTGEYIDKSDEEFALSVGASKVLQKTGNIGELLEALSNLKVLPQRTGFPDGTEGSLAEDEYLKEYNTVLVRRLEAKMKELEGLNRRLVERNAQLEYERRKYRQLFLSANDGIILVDQKSGVITEANEHARKILRLNDNELSYRKLNDLRPFGELLADKISRAECVQFESSYSDGGPETYLDIGGAPIGTEDNLYLIILRNVTRRREWLERFIAMDKLRALGRLSHGLVHEIRNPLNVISVNLQFLERSLEQNTAERRQTQQALEAVTGIEKVIRETMNFAQPQAPAKSPFRLNNIVTEIAGLAKTSLFKSRIRMEIEKTAINDVVLADKSQILHAVLNIVQNSIEAMSRGGTLKFRLEDSDEEGEVILRIVDTGLGMEDEIAKLAMEPFYTTKEGASGMGLSISNRLLELNGASLDIESKPNIGTAVAIHFQRWR